MCTCIHTPCRSGNIINLMLLSSLSFFFVYCVHDLRATCMLPAAERPNFRTSLFRYIPYGATCECSTASAYKCVHKVFRENVKPRVLLLSRRETIIVVSHLVRAILHQIAYHTHSHNMSYYSSKRTTSEKRNLKKNIRIKEIFKINFIDRD